MMKSSQVLLFSLIVLSITQLGCGSQESPKTLNNSVEGYTAIFFNINAASFPAVKPDSLERIEKKLKNIDMTGDDSFWPEKKMFFMHAMGALNFPDTGNYTLRLRYIGKVILRLNNKDVFSVNNQGDSTIQKTQFIVQRNNIFEIEYYDCGLDPVLVLEWSADGKNFEVIPDQAFSAIHKISSGESTGDASVSKDISQVDLNTLTDQEKSGGWKLLFDGKTTSGWHRYNAPGVVGSRWVAEDGCLVFRGRDRFRYELEGYVIEMGGTDKIADGGLDIVTDEAFENFELKLEWKISKGGNSGIFYTVLEDARYPESWYTSPEMQVLDDQSNKDGIIVTHRAGDLYDLIACEEVTVKEQGQWNEVRVVKNKGMVEHWLNGMKVVGYNLNSQEWKEMISKSKFSGLKDYGTVKRGKISLQDHDNTVWYRNIKIRELK